MIKHFAWYLTLGLRPDGGSAQNFSRGCRSFLIAAGLPQGTSNGELCYAHQMARRDRKLTVSVFENTLGPSWDFVVLRYTL
jgi:hypothetical protein